ncbi:ZYRO0E10032p [Zygosaccharomyces rouxii]|uniref:ZYRO0E10032p n=1 Tax=Zygosaccharomyces rouxii (strain ATCC 2623 / CBS 732 / NBRC 1130 / NCYC 568 / NRRL Y-229) TaxID=559307 RepID=C5E4Z6_ZYGRC|nr:uncharacterized protein ZYRO0E10032g [Zygosaccharomyces rouxii]KAH9198037.1 S-adenosyl-L-methionine-dependent methyltransferase [Zygosaccharomyces rouxii]CAR31107.1 ZYRO0E10032p [Zygosaccharomyces rouxii]
MSAFSEKDFDAKSYSSSRPSYPDEFYRVIDEYHVGARNRLIDVGCGPGVATFQLADKLKPFNQIFGTDISNTMVERARGRKGENFEKYEGVNFEVSPGDDFSFLKGPDNKCDMVTAVQCVHWLDFDSFQKSVAAVLREGGTFVIWGYADPIFPEYPKLDALLDDFSYGPDHLGPYWESGRQILRNLLRDLHLNTELFTDFQEACFNIDYIRSNQTDPLLIKRTITLAQFQDYLKTWSAFHSWKKSHSQERDITEGFVDRVQQLYPHLTKRSKFQVVWKSFYKLCRKL